jgi:ribosome biogenesis GTPase
VQVFVGDRVEYEILEPAKGVIRRVLPRDTLLARPPVANVTQALLVFSLLRPLFHPGLLDRSLIEVLLAGLHPIITLSKCDLVDGSLADSLARPYLLAGFPVLLLSVRTGQGVPNLRAHLRGELTVLVGPSGVGKSSLCNALSPTLGLRMGEISEKSQRGKHTTRHVELFSLEADTLVADTPGFSQLEVNIQAAQLSSYFPDFTQFAQNCAYRGCRHMEEVECGVKQAVASGRLASSRYDSYCNIYQELKNKEWSR